MPAPTSLLPLLDGAATHVAGRAVRPAPGQARSWVERELSRAAYRVSPLDRFQAWLGELWTRLTSAARGAPPLPTVLLLLGLVLLVVAALAVAARVRREPAAPAEAAREALGTGTASAAEHRTAAEDALRDGAFDTALVEAYRAMAVRAVQRGLVEERPGLTAHELATDLRPRFPDHADHLERSSRLFDLVFYGDQEASAANALEVLELEAALHDARGARDPHDDHPPTAAVPR